MAEGGREDKKEKLVILSRLSALPHNSIPFITSSTLHAVLMYMPRNLGRISDFNLRALYNAPHANDLQISPVSFIPFGEQERAVHTNVRTHARVT